MDIIVDKLIEDISSLMRTDKEQLSITVNHCKSRGVLGKYELRHFCELGIPIIKIGSTILRVSSKCFFGLVEDHKISYNDILCILGIFAQDLASRTNIQMLKYNG